MTGPQREMLRSNLVSLAQIPVVYDREPVPYAPAGLITISRVANRVAGIPDKRYAVVGNQNFGTVVEWRYQTLGVRFDSYDPDNPAVDFLSDLGAKMWRDALLARFGTVKLVMVDNRDIFDLPHLVDDHVYSSAQMQLIVGYAWADTDTDNDVGQIATVNTTDKVPVTGT